MCQYKSDSLLIVSACYSFKRPDMSSQLNISPKQSSVSVRRMNGDFLSSMILASMLFIVPHSSKEHDYIKRTLLWSQTEGRALFASI